MKLVYKE